MKTPRSLCCTSYQELLGATFCVSNGFGMAVGVGRSIPETLGNIANVLVGVEELDPDPPKMYVHMQPARLRIWFYDKNGWLLKPFQRATIVHPICIRLLDSGLW